jgi:hypothetical protein
VIVICGDVSKTFIKTATRVEDDLTEIIWLTVSASAKQKHPAVCSKYVHDVSSMPESCRRSSATRATRGGCGKLSIREYSYTFCGRFVDCVSEFRFKLDSPYLDI